jgi:hypothetical protein
VDFVQEHMGAFEALADFIGSLKIIVSAKGVPARQSRSAADNRHLCAEALENV